MITRNLLTRSYKLLLTLLVLLMSTNAFAQRLTATGKCFISKLPVWKVLSRLIR